MPRIILTILALTLISCAGGPQKINIGKDQCHFCKMTIMSQNFSCQTVTKKGRVYKYDDLKCQMMDAHRRASAEDAFYVTNFLNENEFIQHKNAQFVHSTNLKSPMAGNVAAVLTHAEAEVLIAEKKGELIKIEDAFK